MAHRLTISRGLVQPESFSGTGEDLLQLSDSHQEHGKTYGDEAQQSRVKAPVFGRKKSLRRDDPKRKRTARDVVWWTEEGQEVSQG